MIDGPTTPTRLLVSAHACGRVYAVRLRGSPTARRRWRVGAGSRAWDRWSSPSRRHDAMGFVPPLSVAECDRRIRRWCVLPLPAAFFCLDPPLAPGHNARAMQSNQRTRISLPPETHRRLKVAAYQLGITAAALATAAIEAYLVRIGETK